VSLTDVNTFTVVAFVFVIALVAMFYVYTQVYAEFVPVIAASGEAVSFMTGIRDAYLWLDYTLLFSYVGFLIASIVSAWFVRTHPVFFILFMVGSLFTTFLAWIFSQVADEFINALPSFLIVINQFPITKGFILNLPMYVLGASAVIAIIQYSKA